MGLGPFLMLDIAEEEDKTRKRTRILRRRRINYGIRSGPLAKLQRQRNLQDIYQLLADWNGSQFLASQPLLHPCRFLCQTVLIWVDSLEFRSSPIGLTCAYMAILLQHWLCQATPATIQP